MLNVKKRKYPAKHITEEHASSQKERNMHIYTVLKMKWKELEVLLLNLLVTSGSGRHVNTL